MQGGCKGGWFWTEIRQHFLGQSEEPNYHLNFREDVKVQTDVASPSSRLLMERLQAMHQYGITDYDLKTLGTFIAGRKEQDLDDKTLSHYNNNLTDGRSRAAIQPDRYFWSIPMGTCNVSVGLDRDLNELYFIILYWSHIGWQYPFSFYIVLVSGIDCSRIYF